MADIRPILADFRRFRLERDGNDYVPDHERILHQVLEDVLGDPDPDVFVTLEVNGEVVTLLIAQGKLRIISIDDTVTNVSFLGELNGRYTEYQSHEWGGADILRFEDTRFSPGQIEITLPAEPAGHSFEVGEQRERRERILAVRGHFRRWADDTR